ncbi:hypothetical protein JCGZ_26659 [Jatropha curcas]|uniref:Uncharacterized protein n=1 Tax=Jatropha curcas TaxID=180498 RepID=A0A067L3T1_JATCU|nr:hypothetical protein JCGZ_26659 [Jatropha curcas]
MTGNNFNFAKYATADDSLARIYENGDRKYAGEELKTKEEIVSPAGLAEKARRMLTTLLPDRNATAALVLGAVAEKERRGRYRSFAVDETKLESTDRTGFPGKSKRTVEGEAILIERAISLLLRYNPTGRRKRVRRRSSDRPAKSDVAEKMKTRRRESCCQR